MAPGSLRSIITKCTGWSCVNGGQITLALCSTPYMSSASYLIPSRRQILLPGPGAPRMQPPTHTERALPQARALCVPSLWPLAQSSFLRLCCSSALSEDVLPNSQWNGGPLILSDCFIFLVNSYHPSINHARTNTSAYKHFEISFRAPVGALLCPFQYFQGLGHSLTGTWKVFNKYLVSIRDK